MAINIGSSAISSIKLGSSTVTAVFQGTNLIYGCVSPLISTTSLSAYYKLNGNLNGTVGPTPLSAPNGVTYSTGKFGDANGSASFNGTTTYLSSSVPDSAYAGSGGNISVMLWIYPTSTGIAATYDITNYFNGTAGWRLRMVGNGVSGQNLVAQIAGTTLTGPIIPINTWTQIGFTYNNNANGFILYVNGSAVATGGTAGMNTTGVSFNFRIGRSHLNTGAANWYPGLVDDVNIWQRALTSTEVATLALNCPLT